MDNFYGFYELGYIEYYWYLLYSLYYEFMEYPIMVRVCSIILTSLFMLIPTSCIVLSCATRYFYVGNANLRRHATPILRHSEKSFPTQTISLQSECAR